MRKLIRVFPHLTIILSTMCLVLFVLDRFNGNMHFLMNEITKWIVAVLSVCAGVTSFLCIGGYLRADEEAERLAEARSKKENPADKPAD